MFSLYIPLYKISKFNITLVLIFITLRSINFEISSILKFISPQGKIKIFIEENFRIVHKAVYVAFEF